MDARKSLGKRLGDFLGLDEDDVVDVLDQLLTIESEEDLLDYLSQLLGSRDDDIQEFVKDVGRFQKGLPIVVVAQKTEEAATKPAPSPAPATTTTSNVKAKQPQKAKAKPSAIGKTPPAPATSTRNNKNAASKSQEEKGPTKETTVPTTASVPATKESVEVPATKEQSVEQVPKLPPKKKYGLPPKGKSQSKPCGCFGTLHRPLTNCLYCGRISCAQEGYDFCPYCGYLVEEVQPPEGEFSKAWQHKERLLRYDRESAKRTVVLDDQADYYNTSWLTEEEQATAELKDEEQRSNAHQRKKQVLNIAF